MELTDLEVLEYLHDAVVTAVVYRLDRDDCREFVLTVTCDPEAGYPPWEGRRVVVRLHDLVVAHHRIFGAVVGQEQINSWGSQLSPPTAAELERLRGSGFGPHGQRFCVTFQSGSVLEGACQRAFVELDDTDEGAWARREVSSPMTTTEDVL